MSEHIILHTSCGSLRGNSYPDYNEYLGIRYGVAKRFAYATAIDRWESEYDATTHGYVCPQTRTYFPHLDVPERRFYFREFRKDQTFSYQEDCLNLNIFTPKEPKHCPVIVFIHGGGFNSGSNYDSAIQGDAYAQKGIVFVSIQYRVGVLGYFTHEEMKKQYGREGNLGLDDQVTAIRWVKNHIGDFGGDPDNITLMGQSAGAISIQYLCLSAKCNGLFQRAIMMSGAGKFPDFALPRPAANTREYWLDFMQEAGAASLEELAQLDLESIFTAIEGIKGRRKDNTYNTMPVIDGYWIEGPVGELIKNPLPVDYMIGYTNNDMYAILMAHISYKFAKANHAFVYYFDIDAPGDDNGAFHSSDIRYAFGTLSSSHRPYSKEDLAISEMLVAYIAQFAATGNPNQPGLPAWYPTSPANRKILHLVTPKARVKMGRANQCKLLINTLTKGEPT